MCEKHYKKVTTICPYCGAGCNIQFTIDEENNKIIEATGDPRGRNNEGTLCLKGRYGWDHLNDPQILTRRIRKPMIRKGGKGSPLEEVSWEEAIQYTADRINEIKKMYGPDTILGAGSARGPGNEAGYITQKFMRAAVGTNNVDHCARICHAASVTGLMGSIGEGAMSVSVPEIEDAEVIFNIGYNGPESHPIVSRRIVKAKQKGCKIICVDPRITETARIADIHLQLKGGTNLALLNAMAYVIVSEDLVDHDFIKDHVDGWEEYKEQILKLNPEELSKICQVSLKKIQQAARIFASSKHTITLWGMGITQFSQGVEGVEGCANLALMTGNFGHYATGVGPVRGQNNVQGTCDMGVSPNVYPGYQAVENDEIREKFEKAWGVKLSPKNGTFLTLFPDLVLHETDPKKKLRCLYVLGEDPAQSDPHLAEARKALAEIDFLIVQDIFFNKTSEYADVILPATGWGEHDAIYTSCDRGFQRVRKLIEPPEGSKTDWQIQCEIATAMGYPMHYNNTQEIWDEMRALCPKFKGATYEKIEKYGSVQWPCWSEDMEDRGTQYLHEGGQFGTPTGRGKLNYRDYKPVHDIESEEYPMSLITCREVGHYSVRTMTGNSRLLRNLEDEPGWIWVNPADCEELGLKDGDLIRVKSARGDTITRCMATERVAKGNTSMTYQWWIGACNELTNGELDPRSRTPEYKFSAIKLEKIEDQELAWNFVKEQYQLIREKMHIEKAGVTK